MKKSLITILCLLLAVCMLAGCGKKQGDSSSADDSSSVSQPVQDSAPAGDSASDSASDSSTDGGAGSEAGALNMADVVAAIEAVAPVAMAQELSPDIDGSADFMTDLFGLDLADVEDYYGKSTMVNVSSDVVLMVKAVPGRVDAVKTALENRRAAIAASFEMYLEDQYTKALNGRVVTKGDYVLLVIAGDSERIADGEVDAVYAELDEAIDQALA